MVERHKQRSAFRATPREVNYIEVARKGARKGGAWKAARDVTRTAWEGILNDGAPNGLSAEGHNDLGDAYRHYMTSAILAKRLTAVVAKLLGDLNEDVNGAGGIENEMDYTNNAAGRDAASNNETTFEIQMQFLKDVAEGRILIIDDDGDVLRQTDIRDLPAHDGDAVEDRYLPDRDDTLTA